jgi:UDP-N-acetylglucosamine acyltransferase
MSNVNPAYRAVQAAQAAQSARVHPTAIIAPEAELADDIVVGPYVVIEGRVKIGPGCVIRPYVHLCGPLTMGRNNTVYSGTVIGERPQHLLFNPAEPTGVEIGDGNIIREHVTIHRGTTQSWTTRIGSDNFLMANCHVAHDCQIGNRCIITNGALLAGHCSLGDQVYLSGNCAIHQFVRIGKLALLSGLSSTTKDIPPYILQYGRDVVGGVNVVGMRRAGMPREDIDAVRRAFHILYRESLGVPAALARVEHELGAFAPVQEMLAFIRQSHRGINLNRERNQEAA